MSFRLHAKLRADSTLVERRGSLQIRLHNDARWPWVILVPSDDAYRELTELSAHAAKQLWASIGDISARLLAWSPVSKINIACLGNLVPQLHIHVVGRWQADPAWPGPIWGRAEPRSYAAIERKRLTAHLKMQANAALVPA